MRLTRRRETPAISDDEPTWLQVCIGRKRSAQRAGVFGGERS